MKSKMMFEKPEDPRKEMRKEKAEDAQKVRAVKTIAKEQVKDHEKRMHKKKMASGGEVRGIGAARPQKFTRNG